MPWDVPSNKDLVCPMIRFSISSSPILPGRFLITTAWSLYFFAVKIYKALLISTGKYPLYIDSLQVEDPGLLYSHLTRETSKDPRSIRRFLWCRPLANPSPLFTLFFGGMVVTCIFVPNLIVYWERNMFWRISFESSPTYFWQRAYHYLLLFHLNVK